MLQIAVRKSKTISLKITRATVASLVKESDRGCVILFGSLLEGILERMHEAFVTKNLKGSKSAGNFFQEALTGLYGPLSNFAGKINIAYAYGLISSEEYEGLNIIRKLRNEAAHGSFEFSFQDPGVKSLINQLGAYETIKREAAYMERASILSGMDDSKRHFVLSSLGLRHLLYDKL